MSSKEKGRGKAVRRSDLRNLEKTKGRKEVLCGQPLSSGVEDVKVLGYMYGTRCIRNPISTDCA